MIFGTLGGIGLLVGPAGLLVLKRSRNRDITDEGQAGMDTAFLVLLLLASASGLLLLVLRETSAMGTLLVVHLGIVMGLFLYNALRQVRARDLPFRRHSKIRIGTETKAGAGGIAGVRVRGSGISKTIIGFRVRGSGDKKKI